MYTALSRVKTLDGLYILNGFDKKHLKCDIRSLNEMTRLRRQNQFRLRVAVTGPCLTYTSCNSMGVKLSSGEIFVNWALLRTQDVRTDVWSNKHEMGYNSRKNQRSWSTKIPNMEKMRQKTND
jgi:hypothetical protein